MSSALWSSSYSGQPTPVPCASGQQPFDSAAAAPGRTSAAAPGGRAPAAAPAAAVAAPPPSHGWRPVPCPPPTLAAAAAAAADARGAQAVTAEQLDAEERYHLPFAPSRVAWPDPALAQLLAQQAEAIDDDQLPLITARRQAFTSLQQPQQQQQPTVGILSQALLRAAAASSSGAAAATDAPADRDRSTSEPPGDAAAATASAGGPGRLAAVPVAPRVTVALGPPGGDWLDVPPSYLPLWQQLRLRPAAGAKPLVWFAICPEGLQDATEAFLNDLGAAYSACHLGTHEPATAAIPPSALPPSAAPPPAVIVAPYSGGGGGGGGWLGALRHACRQLQGVLTLTPPALSYHPRTLDAPPEASVVVYVVAPPGSNDQQLLDTFLTAAQYLGPLLPDPPEGGPGTRRTAGGLGGGPRGGIGGGPADLVKTGAAGGGGGVQSETGAAPEQCSQAQGGGGGSGGGAAAAAAAARAPPATGFSGVSPGQGTPRSGPGGPSAEPTPARLPVAGAAPDAASPAAAAAALPHPAGASGGSGRAAGQGARAAAGAGAAMGDGSGVALYETSTGSMQPPVSLAAQGRGRRMDVALQLLRAGTVEAPSEGDVRALALAVYCRTRRRRRRPPKDLSIFPHAHAMEPAPSDNTASDLAASLAPWAAGGGGHRGGAASLLTSPSPIVRRPPAPLDGHAVYAPPFVLPPPPESPQPGQDPRQQQQQQQLSQAQQQQSQLQSQGLYHHHLHSHSPNTVEHRTLHVCACWVTLGGRASGAAGQQQGRGGGVLLALCAADCRGELLTTQLVPLCGARKALALEPPGGSGGVEAARRAAAAVAAAGMRRAMQLATQIGASARAGVAVSRLAVTLIGPLGREDEAAWAAAGTAAAARAGLTAVPLPSAATSDGGSGNFTDGGAQAGDGEGQVQEAAAAAAAAAEDPWWETGAAGAAGAGAVDDGPDGGMLLSQPSIGLPRDGSGADGTAAPAAASAAGAAAGVVAAAPATAPRDMTPAHPPQHPAGGLRGPLPGAPGARLEEMSICRLDALGPLVLPAAAAAAVVSLFGASGGGADAAVGDGSHRGSDGAADGDGADAAAAAGGPNTSAGPSQAATAPVVLGQLLFEPGLAASSGQQGQGGSSGSGGGPVSASSVLVTSDPALMLGIPPWMLQQLQRQQEQQQRQGATAQPQCFLQQAVPPADAPTGELPASACVAHTATLLALATRSPPQPSAARGGAITTASAAPDAPRTKRQRQTGPSADDGSSGSSPGALAAAAAASRVASDLGQLSCLSAGWHALRGADAGPALARWAAAPGGDGDTPGPLLPLHCAVALRALALGDAGNRCV